MFIYTSVAVGVNKNDTQRTVIDVARYRCIQLSQSTAR